MHSLWLGHIGTHTYYSISLTVLVATHFRLTITTSATELKHFVL